MFALATEGGCALRWRRMKLHNQTAQPRRLHLFCAAMSCFIVFSGCREKSRSGQTISRQELDTVIKATGRADSLKMALEQGFGKRGYRFSVAFSGGTDSNIVKSLSGGPTSLSVYGARSFDEAIKLDRELHDRFDKQELAGIEILYELHPEWHYGMPIMYPAAALAKSAKFDADIKDRQQAGAGQPATRPESEPEGSQKPQPESEGRSR